MIFAETSLRVRVAHRRLGPFCAKGISECLKRLLRTKESRKRKLTQQAAEEKCTIYRKGKAESASPILQVQTMVCKGRCNSGVATLSNCFWRSDRLEQCKKQYMRDRHKNGRALSICTVRQRGGESLLLKHSCTHSSSAARFSPQCWQNLKNDSALPPQ